ncbi:MAG TPA: condensation domain-containing protein [Candidatus Angelobacter sp.]
MLKTTANQSEARRILLDKYLRGEFARGPSPKLRRDGKGEAPASLSQEQVWLHSQEDGANPQTYTESITIYRNGPLDLDALKQSLKEILRRHEIWRSSFEMNEGQLRQVIGAITDFPLTVVDLRDPPASEREQEATRIGNAQARRPFDLRRGPLVRATVVSLNDQHHRLYIDMHQIITDGISVFQILPMELASLYDSFLTGNPACLPELTWQFADYATWQREWLQGPALQKQIDYWRDHLAIRTSSLRWPNDHTRPPQETHRAKIEPFAVSWQTLDELQTIRKQAGISLFAALVAVFTALLHSYSEQDDMVLGTLAPCGRHHTGFQKLLGYFMNPVPLPFRVSGADSFRDLMLQAQEVISGAISHADVPFEQVIRTLGIQTAPGRHPLFQIAISLAPAVASLPPAWDMTPMDVESGAGRWDLYIEMSERREYLLGRAQYNPDVCSQSTVAALLDHFRQLAKLAGADPSRCLSDLLTAANIRNTGRGR